MLHFPSVSGPNMCALRNGEFLALYFFLRTNHLGTLANPLFRRRFLAHRDHLKKRYCAKFRFQASDGVFQIARLHRFRLLMVILSVGKALR